MALLAVGVFPCADLPLQRGLTPLLLGFGGFDFPSPTLSPDALSCLSRGLSGPAVARNPSAPARRLFHLGGWGATDWRISLARYSPQEKDRGMLALIMTSGNARAASRVLEAEGERVPHQTLDFWRKKDHSRYQELEDTYAARIRNNLALDCETLAKAYSALERETLIRAQQTLPKLEPKDLPNAARSYAVAKAVQIDKSALLRGLPTQITESRNPDQLLSGIAVKLGITTKA